MSLLCSGAGFPQREGTSAGDLGRGVSSWTIRNVCNGAYVQKTANMAISGKVVCWKFFLVLIE